MSIEHKKSVELTLLSVPPIEAFALPNMSELTTRSPRRYITINYTYNNMDCARVIHKQALPHKDRCSEMKLYIP